MTIEDIARQFATEGTIGEVKIHAGGHINDSYRLVNSTRWSSGLPSAKG